MVSLIESEICGRLTSWEAPAQGIVSQMRILGGSLGVAMSTALVHREISDNLGGISSPDGLVGMGRNGNGLTQQQGQPVSRAYSNAFHNGMIAATVVSAAATLVALGAYRYGERPLLKDQRARLIEAETNRRTVSFQQRDQADEHTDKS